MKKKYQLASLLLLIAGCTDDDKNNSMSSEEAGESSPIQEMAADTPAVTVVDGPPTMSDSTPEAGAMAVDGDMTTEAGMATDGEMAADMGMETDMQMSEPGTYTRIAGGTFAPLAGYEAMPALGSAQLVVGAEQTRVSLQINGLAPDTAYPAHVHALPCALQGGGHYKINPAVMDTMEDNELWPAFTTDADGQATVESVFAHAARADAMAVVIHDPNADGAKMHCADLLVDEEELVELAGDFQPFAAAEELDMAIQGRATLRRAGETTEVALAVEGLSSTETYAAHVHALPCGVLEAGGHYKIDPSIADTSETNELWPGVDVDDDGEIDSEKTFSHLARPDAQSVVLHRVIGDTAAKVACADLVTVNPRLRITSGDAILLPAGMERTPQLVAEGEMKRHLDGTTSTEVEVSDLMPETAYDIHVHNRPCEVSSGGGHYKVDPTIAETAADNELWLSLTTDDDGDGDFELEDLPHLPRAEAQSIVIHDGDGERLACIPLD